jgi:hypothetical protein
MNGHGKTSFLISLYLGLFGKFGLRHCEGFGLLAAEDYKSYRDAVSKFRRNSAVSDEPTVIDITLTPSWRDTDEEEVRVVRRWFFSGRNEPKQGEAFEEVDLYVGGRLQKPGNLEKDPLLLAQERVERHLFPPHVAPAFFFDGEQAQKLIENSGEEGLKRAVRVMFGTKVVEDLTETMRQYLARVRQNTGGKRKTSEQQVVLEAKLHERQTLNDQIAKKQSDLQKLEHDKDEKEQKRGSLHENLARMGGVVNANAVQIQNKYVLAEKEQADAEKSLAETVKNLGMSLAMFRLAPAIRNRLRAEEQLESWESLKRGTIDNRDKVLATAMPEPDPLLGNLSTEIREKVRNRFGEALERIYNPPPFNCPENYLLGHVKGDAKARVLAQLAQAQSTEPSQTHPGGKPVDFVLNGPAATPHIALMGAVGKGKTTTGVQIALDLLKKAQIPILFIDPKGEFVADGRAIGALTTVVGLYLLTQYLAPPELRKARKKIKIGPATTDSIEEIFDSTTQFWDALKANVAPIREVLASNPEDELASKYRRTDGGNILFRTVGLAAFARAARTMMDKGLTAKQAVGALAAKVPLELDDELWREVLWRHETKTMLHKYVRLAQNIMLYRVKAYPNSKESLFKEYARITGRTYPK